MSCLLWERTMEALDLVLLQDSAYGLIPSVDSNLYLFPVTTQTMNITAFREFCGA